MNLFTHDTSGTAASTWRSHVGFEAMGVLDLDRLDRAVHGERLRRLVVLAAHPDDESLGAAGLMLRAHQADIAVEVVLVTAGERSHPHSTTTTSSQLREIRTAEAARAITHLAPDTVIEHLDVPDGDVASATEQIITRLVQLLGDARDTVIAAPWRQDGHPDHEACGRVAAVAAHRTGALLVEYPVWWWHWATPADAPWGDLMALALRPHEVAAKTRAIAAHQSQVAALSDEPGDETLLSPDFLEHFSGDREVFVKGGPARVWEQGGGIDVSSQPGSPDSALDDLHRRHREPWGTTTRWYEHRKRDLTLAVLPRQRFRRGLELGCSTGTLAAELAQRCDELCAIDESAHAIQSARGALAHFSHVDVEHRSIPEDWPSGTFDLLVVSEIAYFLSPHALDRLVDRVRSSRTSDGVVVLCHWNHPVRGWVLDGPQSNRRISVGLGLPLLATYRDRDIEIVLLGPESATPEPTR